MRSKGPMILLAIAMIGTALSGCLAQTSAASPAAAGSSGDGEPADNATREELMTHRITFEPGAGQWRMTRLFVGDLMGDADSANLVIASMPKDGAEPYLGVGIHATLDGEEAPPVVVWLAASEDGPNATTISMSGDPPGSVDLAFILGSNEEAATYHLGLVNDTMARLPGPHLARLVAHRPALDVVPDATGEGGAAGTAGLQATPSSDHIIERGRIDLELEETVAPFASLKREVSVTAGDQMEAGIGGVLLGGTSRAGTSSWSYDVSLGDHAWSDEGRDIQPREIGSRVAHLAGDLLGIEDAFMFASVDHAGGSADLALDREFTGAGQLTVATWGWSTADPAGTYGWTWEDVEV